ncbi:MAG TPA: ABC transporter ATP-binding protein [Gaiellales bacterium]|nr:ABC transporter ATP-binding protein [Gaiellales bacterium]
MEAAVRTRGLTKRYGPTLALDGLTLTIPRGEVFGFLGPNGAGKTTTIRLLLGLQRPTSGSCSIFACDSWAGAVEAHRRLAYVAGEPMLWPGLTGEECLRFLGRLHGRVDSGYRDLLTERFRFDPAKKVRDYSKGNRQKIQLIAAFATRAELLILDEPTGGLDPLMEQAFRETVAEARSAGAAVFLSSHILSEVEAVCDRIGILRDGRLVEQGTLAELRHLSQHVVDVTFPDEPPQLPALPGVTATRIGSNSVRFGVPGPVGPLLDALSGTGVVSLASREQSLEELFLAHYGASDGKAAEDG